MVVGRVELTRNEREEIREYLLGGLNGQTEGMISLRWVWYGKVVVGRQGMWRIVDEALGNEVRWDYPFVRIPPVPLASDMEPAHRTCWLQIAIAIADQTGLIADPEVIGAIERRVTEEVLEGRMVGGDAGTKVATTEGGREIRKFAWSGDGKLAAVVAGVWRLATGEMVEVSDHKWHIMEL